MTAINKEKLQQIVMQHVGENLVMQRAGAALGLGLAPSDYVRHFPQNNTTTNINITSPPDAQGATQQPANPPATQTPDSTPPPVTKPTTPIDPPVSSQPTSTPVLTPSDLSSTTPGTISKALIAAIALGIGGGGLTIGALASRLFDPPAVTTQPPAVTTPAEAAAKVHIFYGDQEILPDKPATANLPVTK